MRIDEAGKGSEALRVDSLQRGELALLVLLDDALDAALSHDDAPRCRLPLLFDEEPASGDEELFSRKNQTPVAAP